MTTFKNSSRVRFSQRKKAGCLFLYDFYFKFLLNCPPPYRRKAEGHCFRLSIVRGAWCVVRGSGFLVGTLSPQLLPQFSANPFETLQGLLRWSENLHVVFSESWNYFLSLFCIFNLDIFWALILQKCIGSRYLVPSTPPTVFGQSFWNFTRALRMVWSYACVFFRILKLFFITFFAFLTLIFFNPNATEVYRG